VSIGPRVESKLSSQSKPVPLFQSAPVAVRESLGVARRAYDMSDDELFELGLEAQQGLAHRLAVGGAQAPGPVDRPVSGAARLLVPA